MNMMAMSILASTLGCLIWGAILGMIRGRNRSILRLIIIVASALLSLAMRNTLVDVIMGLEIEGETIMESLTAEMSGSEATAEFMTSLFSILFGLVSYIAIFGILQFVTWIIIFPICKIFVKKDKDKKKVGAGALIGLAQGFIIAFATCTPLVGMLTQVERLMPLVEELNGEPSSEEGAGFDISADDAISTFDANGNEFVLMEEEYGLEQGAGVAMDSPEAMFKGFSNSGVAKFYTAIGGWYYDMIGTVKVEGVNVSLDDYIDIIDVLVIFSNEVFVDNSPLQADIEKLPTADNMVEQAEIMSNIGETLLAVGDKVDGLDGGGRHLMGTFVEMIKEMATASGPVYEGGDYEDDDGDGIVNIEDEDANGNDIPDVEEKEPLDPEMEKLVDTISVDTFNFTDAGMAFISMSEYLLKVSESLEGMRLNEEDVANIVDAINGNLLIKEMIGNTQIIKIDAREADMFYQYIAENVDEEDRTTFWNMFGVN